MQKGTVRWFNASKGYGFIIPDGGTKDVFVHISSLNKSNPRLDGLEEGDRVSFEVQTSQKGLSAVSITKIPRAKAKAA